MSGSHQFWAFIRFLLVGGSFALVYAVLTAGLIRFADTPPLLTSMIIYLLCIPAAFVAQKRFAFRADQSGKGAMLMYVATQFGSLIFVSTIINRFVTKNFFFDTAILLTAAGTAAVVSFLICRYVIFRPRPE